MSRAAKTSSWVVPPALPSAAAKGGVATGDLVSNRAESCARRTPSRSAATVELRIPKFSAGTAAVSRALPRCTSIAIAAASSDKAVAGGVKGSADWRAEVKIGVSMPDRSSVDNTGGTPGRPPDPSDRIRPSPSLSGVIAIFGTPALFLSTKSGGGGVGAQMALSTAENCVVPSWDDASGEVGFRESLMPSAVEALAVRTVPFRFEETGPGGAPPPVSGGGGAFGSGGGGAAMFTRRRLQQGGQTTGAPVSIG